MEENRENSLLDEVMEENAESGYRIEDDIAAERVMKLIADTNAEIDGYINIYKERIKAMEDRKAFIIERYTNALQQYFATVPHEKTKTTESYKLANGTISMKKQAPEYVRDDAVLIPWLEKNSPDHLKKTVSVDWSALKKMTALDGQNVALKETGELIPGITVTERPDKFEVKPKEGK